MSRLSGIELLLGWLAAITGAGLALSLWLGGAIAPQNSATIFFIFGVIFLVIAVSVTVEATTGSLGARILLLLGALALTGVFVISFISLLAIPTLLAIAATLLAFTRPHHPAAARAGQ